MKELSKLISSQQLLYLRHKMFLKRSGRRWQGEIQTLIVFAVSLSNVQNQHPYSKSSSKDRRLLQFTAFLQLEKKKRNLSLEAKVRRRWVVSCFALQFSCALRLSTASSQTHHVQNMYLSLQSLTVLGRALEYLSLG